MDNGKLSETTPGSAYWVTPQDISYHWSLLVPSLESAAVDHANEEMTISLIVGNGLVADVLEARYCRFEPRNGNGKVQEAQPWWSLIRRLMKATSELNGRRAMLTTRVMLNTAGQPVKWTAPECLEMEPRRV